MSRIYIVIDDHQDWEPYYPSEHILTLQEYLAIEDSAQHRVRVINLCDNYQYLRDGYYCSLLAEARGHHVIPSISVLNDLSQPMLYQLQLGRIADILDRTLGSKAAGTEITVNSYFGQVNNPDFKALARFMFEKLPCPVLSMTLRYEQKWEISQIRSVNHRQLSDAEQTEFADALDYFSSKIWRQGKKHKPARYDLAILHNPEEKLPPSNAQALKRFIRAGKNLGVSVELISPADYIRLAEFDALLIRETTSIDHHTYRFARKAEAEGMVVIDDPTSILRCTNKIYLAKLFETNKVPAPRTLFLRNASADTLEQAIETLGLPIVLKIPDGSFSRGVVKVNTAAELEQQAAKLFTQTSLLLAQEYLYTDFDWRIGILNNRPLYACRYYMVKKHWQIYRHSEGKQTRSGGFDTLPTFEVPKAVLQAAVRASRSIGSGLYGVDVKELNGKAYVIEVNDNPNIDAGIEDKYLGDALYTEILEHFIERLEAQKQLKSN